MAYLDSYLVCTTEKEFTNKVQQDLTVAALFLGSDPEIVDEIKQATIDVANRKGFSFSKDFRI